MAKKRGNPFTGDGPANRKAWSTGTLQGQDSVRVAAHERKRPVRAHLGPQKKEHAAMAQTVDERIVDNSFAGAGLESQAGPQNVTGLAGEPQINHLKAAVGLLNRRRV